MRICILLSCFVFLASFAFSAQTSSITVGHQQKEILILETKTIKDKPAYFIRYISANNGTFQRILTADLYQQLSENIHSFEKQFALMDKSTAIEPCSEEIIFKIDKNQKNICVDGSKQKDKKNLKKWLTANSNFAVRRY